MQALVVAVVFLLLWSDRCRGFWDHASVVEITDVSFHKQTHVHENILVTYYHPENVRCQKFLMEYDRAAELLANENAVLGKVDCKTRGRNTCIAQNVDTFPLVHLYRNGTFVKEYKYSEIVWSLVKFMRAQVRPVSHEIFSIEEFREYLMEQRDAILVGFFAEETKMMRAFYAIARDMNECVVFAHSHCDNLLRRERVYDGIVLFRPVRFPNRFEEEKVLYTGRPVMGEIKTFIIANYHGLVGRRTPFVVKEFNEPLVVLYYKVHPAHMFREPYYWRTRVLKVAKKYQSRATFAVSDRDLFGPELREVGVYGRGGPEPVVAAWSLDAKRFKMMETFSGDALDRFVGALVDGKLEPYDPSQEPVEGDAVLEVAADSFQKTVMENGKDTLLELYASWCTRSRHFAATYRLVGEMLRDEEGVEVVKMDAASNEVPVLFEVLAYPTIYWLRKGRTEMPVLYSGPLSAESLLKFVAQRATVELKNFDRDGNCKEATADATGEATADATEEATAEASGPSKTEL